MATRRPRPGGRGGETQHSRLYSRSLGAQNTVSEMFKEILIGGLSGKKEQGYNEGRVISFSLSVLEKRRGPGGPAFSFCQAVFSGPGASSPFPSPLGNHVPSFFRDPAGAEKLRRSSAAAFSGFAFLLSGAKTDGAKGSQKRGRGLGEAQDGEAERGDLQQARLPPEPHGHER